MSEVTGWVFTICSGALVCGVVSALIPSKSYQGAIQLLLGLFMLFCFLTPVSMNWELPQVDLAAAEEERLAAADEAQQQLSQRVERESVAALTQAGQVALAEYGVQEGELALSLAPDEDGNMVATVQLPERCRAQHTVLHRLLEYEFGIPVRMEY